MTVTHVEPRVLIDALKFGEGPRWHGERLYFSDMHAGTVHTVDLDARLETLAEVPNSPSGLGFDPEGRMLVVSMQDQKVLRSSSTVKAGEHVELEPFADLSRFTNTRCNDMVVDAQGRAYVGNFGFGLFSQDKPRTTCLVLVSPDGSARVVAEELLFPNGMVITPDGRTLIVAETFAMRLSAFEIAADGSLSNRRVFAQFERVFPDGICLDAEGCVWVANPTPPGGFVRVADGGEIREQLSAQADVDSPAPVGAFANGEKGRAGYACMLGGPERRTLFMLEGFSSRPADAVVGNARIRCVEVDVPGAGWP
jgi:sugar lactone lactonase YvrE